MPLDPWSTADLTNLLNDEDLPRPDGFWRNMFTQVFYSEAQEIYFDQLPDEDRRMAPFVSWNVQVPMMKDRTRALASFRPAYVKIGHAVTPDKTVVMRPGERPFGSLTMEQRLDAIRADNIRAENDSIDRREDWMACQAVSFGSVTVTGEDYPTQVVNFGRDAGLTMTLGSGARWNEETGEPNADVNALRKRAYTKGKAEVRRLVMGPDAFEAWSTHPSTQRLLNNQQRGSTTDFNNTGYVDSNSPAQFQARVSGPNGGSIIEVWTYSNSYENPENGQMVEMLDPRDVIGVGPNMRGIRCYGAIMNLRSLVATDRFPMNWEQVNPSREFTSVESAPLMAVLNPNNTFRARVLA